MMTLGFYFTLNENSNCAKAAAAGNTRAVVLNFIKKFQFPNMRTNVAFNECKDDGIKLAPMRVIVKVLYTMNLLHGRDFALKNKSPCSACEFQAKQGISIWGIKLLFFSV